MTNQDESAQFRDVPLYAVVSDAVKSSTDLTGSTSLAIVVAAALNQLAEDGKCPDLHDSIMTAIAFHEERKRMNMAELLGTLECVKLQLHEMALIDARTEAATEQS